MPFEFRCTQCDRLLRTADGSQGKNAKCPSCGHIMQVPEAGGGGLDADSPVSVPPPPPDAPQDNPFSTPAAQAPASPFTSESGPPPPADSDNPYQSPQSYSEAGKQLPPGGVLAYASARVSGPATGLIALGILGLALQAAGLAFQVFGFWIAAGKPFNAPFETAAALASGGIGLVTSGLLLWGGLRMKSLRTYPLALTTSIVAVVPCFSPCCLVGIPLGIWSLVVLSDGWVKAGFEATRSAATAQTPFAQAGRPGRDPAW